MAKTSGKPSVKYNPSVLNTWIAQSGLADIYKEFLVATEGPNDGKCLITVCERIQRTFGKLGFWSKNEPFDQWVDLVDKVIQHSVWLQQNVGVHLYPEPRITRKEPHPINSLYGKIKEFPIYAMLSDEHQDPDLRIQYGSLQLHVILARWREAENVGKKDQNAQLSPLEVLQIKRDSVQRRVRLSAGLAKAVRDLSMNMFAPLLEHLQPQLDPSGFRDRLLKETKLPLGDHYQDHFDVIRKWCLKDWGAKPGRGGRSSGARGPGRPKYSEYVGYGNLRLSVSLPLEEGAPNQEAILNRACSDEQAFDLGLHPLERAGGDTIILSEVEGAGNTSEATAIARAGSRHFEINRRLFPWSNDRLRLEDFRRGILPELLRACDSQSISHDELEIATLLAVSIETGRPPEDVLAIPIERNPNASLTYQRPSSPMQRGAFFWSAIEPDYKTEWTIDRSKEEARATYLRFPASMLVTALVERLFDQTKFNLGKMFRQQMNHEEALARWIKKHDCTGRATARRLARLRWESLHQLTGGDLATACLTLGVPETLAAVALHYAALKVSEARDFFERSSRVLWGEHFGTEPVDYEGVSAEESRKLIGIRAFPKLETVRDIVTGLRNVSKEFFQIPPEDFDFGRHAELLNRAVLYAVWHQMHAFATRAIVDAYQEVSLFSQDGISTLRDKDFEDGHKARMIWADETLLTHMKAIEKRLAQLREGKSEKKFPEESTLWLISPDGAIESITPTTIATHLGRAFPFPVNTPRKVMRYLLRIHKLSHEEAEVFMGHWWQAREPWSPFSSFAWDTYLEKLKTLVPSILDSLGFIWPPGRSAA